MTCIENDEHYFTFYNITEEGTKNTNHIEYFITTPTLHTNLQLMHVGGSSSEL